MKLKVMTRKQLVSFLIFRENLIIIIIIIFLLEKVVLWWFSLPLIETTQNSNILPWKHLVKKFISFVFFALQLSCSFIYNSLQVVCVFFHHGEHVVYYTNGSERKKKENWEKNSRELSASLRCRHKLCRTWHGEAIIVTKLNLRSLAKSI